MVAIVYMAAGMSSRFGGFIKGLTKITENKTLIEVSIDQALPAGYDEIILIVSEQTKPAFETHFGNEYKGVPVTYVIQPKPEGRDKPWGTTHAVIQLVLILKKPFVVVNSDDIYGEHALEVMYKDAKESLCATVGYELQNVLPESAEVNRGIFEVEDDKVVKITEMLNISNSNFESKGLQQKSLANMNIFALTPDVLTQLQTLFDEFIAQNKDDPKKESILPVDLCTLILENKLSLRVHPTKDTCLGVTWQEDVETLKAALQKATQNNTSNTL